MTYTVRFAPEASDQLVALEKYIAMAASAQVAAAYVEAIVTYCEGIAVFPHRGSARDDLMAGLRTTSFRKRVVIGFFVDERARLVTIAGVFYGGQDITRFLSEEP